MPRKRTTSKPLISIAIPVYNSESTVAAAVASALNQRSVDFEWEVVVSQNGSTDGTAAVLAALESPRLKVTTWDSTVDMWENHNRCIKQATGDYVLFCHADDTLMPNALSTLGARVAMRSFPERYMAFGYSMFHDPLSRWTICGLPLDTPVAGESAALPHTLGGICPSGALYSRRALAQRGGFYPSTIYGSFSDLSTGLAMALDGFTFEFVAGLWLRRVASGTESGLTAEAAATRLFDAFDAVLAEFGVEQLQRVSGQSLRLPINYLTLLDSYLLRTGRLPRQVARALLVRRMSPGLVRSGNAGRLARVAALGN
jgi:glycosyltransferase involved in cell wall biosynthesis